MRFFIIGYLVFGVTNVASSSSAKAHFQHTIPEEEQEDNVEEKGFSAAGTRDSVNHNNYAHKSRSLGGVSGLKDEWNLLGNEIDLDEGDKHKEVSSVAISGNGKRIAIGDFKRRAPIQKAGRIRIFELSEGIWTRVGQEVFMGGSGTSLRWTDFSIALSKNGNRVIVGAINDHPLIDYPGEARVFEYNGKSWEQLGATFSGKPLKDRFGKSVTMSDDGNRIAIGSDGGRVEAYEWSKQSWTKMGNSFVGDDEFGWFVNMAGNGNRLAIGDFYSMGGAFEWVNNSSWVPMEYDFGGEDSYEWLSVMSHTGNRLAISSVGYDESKGYVRVFDWIKSTWVQVGDAIVGWEEGENVGRILSLSDDGRVLAVGSHNYNGNRGHVRVFEYNGSSWKLLGQQVLGKYRDDKDAFTGWGVGMSLSGDGERFVAVGRDYASIYELSTVCNSPTINKRRDKGVFLWNDCFSNQWHVRAVAGGRSGVRIRGTLVPDKSGGTKVNKKVSLEKMDKVNLPDFNFQVDKNDMDGFDFRLGGNACLTIHSSNDVPLFVGKDRVEFRESLRIPSLELCDGPQLEYLFDLDLNTDTGQREWDGDHNQKQGRTFTNPYGFSSRAIFLGESEHMVISRAKRLQMESYTMMAWVRYKDSRYSSDGSQTIVQKGGALWLNIMTDTGLVRAGGFFGGCGKTNSFRMDSTIPVPKETWTHVAVTNNLTAMKIHINGELAGERKLPMPKPYCINNRPFNIGSTYRPKESCCHFNGLIDSVRVYDRALSQDEIWSDMFCN